MRLNFALNRLVVRSRFVVLAAATIAAAASVGASQPGRTGRPQPWRQYSSPEQAGFDSASLGKARAFAESVKSGAVMIVYRGAAVAAWGAVERNFMAHSVRKSLAGALYGIAAADKRLNLDATLAELKIDDDPPLTGGEKQARVRDLLAARSGVYHAAAYADSSQDTSRPARGSQPPGSFWFYNNWDFNTAETIFESVTGEDLYASFGKRIAAPIGMEDYSPANGFEALEPGQSLIPAHTVRISARDLARFGVLYEEGGRWAGQQVVPAEWVRESLRPHSEFGNGSGYGYLWWTYGPGSLGEKYPIANRLSIQVARGTGGQVLFLLPSEDLVVVHRADTDNNRSVAGPQVWGLLEQILAARTTTPAKAPAFTSLRPVPFESQAPASPPAAFLPLDEASMRRVSGEYDIGGGAAIRVFVHQNRLFVEVPRQGTAELFALARSRFTIRVMTGVTVDFSESASGAVEAVALTLGPQRIEGRRRSAAGGVASARDSMIVTTEWVAQHLKDADLVLLHVGEKKDYDAAHLPGAQFLPRESFGIRDSESNLMLQLPPVPALVEQLGALGVSDTSRVVLYFGTDWVTPTARAYVTFDYLGLGDRTSIMDGGLPAWQAEHRSVTAEVIPARPGRFTPRPRADVIAGLADVQSHLRAPGTIVVDSRTPEFYAGEKPGSMPRAGRIPGARNIPFSSLVAGDNKLKDAASLRAIYAEQGAVEGKSLITYCHIGQQASLGYFVAKYLGFPVRLYDGSFEEWSRHAELPVETGKEPRD